MISINDFKLKIESSLKSIDDKSDTYRNSFYIMRISFIVITGVITILSGLQGIKDKTILLNFVLSLGAIITALTSCDTLFQIETKKNVYKLMKVELKEIKNEIDLYSQDPEKLKKMIDEVLYPKYINTMAYAKVFLERKETSS